MALDLKDIRCKIDPVTHAFLSGDAVSKGVDVCVVIREILDSWAEIRRVAHIESHKRLHAEGLVGAVQGIAGHIRNGLNSLGIEDPE